MARCKPCRLPQSRILYCQTRLPSNLKPTARECVYSVKRGHFQSREKDGEYTIRSAVAENPMLQANLVAVCFIDAELLPIEVFHCVNENLRPVFSPMILTLTR